MSIFWMKWLLKCRFWLSNDCSDEGTPYAERLKEFRIKLAVIDVGGAGGRGDSDFLENELVNALLEVDHPLVEGTEQVLDVGQNSGHICQDNAGRLVVGLDRFTVLAQVAREGVENRGEVAGLAVGSLPAVLKEGLEGEASEEPVDLDLPWLVLLLRGRF